RLQPLKVSLSKMEVPRDTKTNASTVAAITKALEVNRREIVRIDALVARARSLNERIALINIVVRLTGKSLKLVKAVHKLEQPRRDLLTLAQNVMLFAQREFKERGIPEKPMFVPLEFDSIWRSSLSLRESPIQNEDASVFVPPNLIKKRANLGLKRAFFTDRQWLLFEETVESFRKDLDSHRKYKRRKPRPSLRFLFEAVLVKLAWDLRWRDLPALLRKLRPELPAFPLGECRRLYRDLYNTGRLQAIYKQLHWHLHVYGDTTLERLVEEGAFYLDKKGVHLAPGRALDWRLFAAFLLLQRAFHNWRVLERENEAERRRQGRYYRLPSVHLPHLKESLRQLLSLPPDIQFSNPLIIEALEKSPTFKKWRQIEKREKLVSSRLASSPKHGTLKPET
ncbi:MAG: hypothetical protein AB1750_14740, partial [Chloroflexota bacterium]